MFRVFFPWLQPLDLLFKFRCNHFVLQNDVYKEIAKLCKGGIHVRISYVNTNGNPADLISRGESLDKFET